MAYRGDQEGFHSINDMGFQDKGDRVLGLLKELGLKGSITVLDGKVGTSAWTDEKSATFALIDLVRGMEDRDQIEAAIHTCWGYRRADQN